jgi:hypothetical protein
MDGIWMGLSALQGASFGTQRDIPAEEVFDWLETKYRDMAKKCSR